MSRGAGRGTRALATAGALLLVGALAGCGDAPEGPPPDRADARSAWVRITPEGLGALPGTLLGEASFRYELAATRDGDLEVCPEGGCAVDLSLLSAAAQPADGRIGVHASVRARTVVPVRYGQSWPCMFTGTPACRVDLDTARSGARGIGVQAAVRIALDGDGLARAALQSAQVDEGIDPADLVVSGVNTCGRVWCGLSKLVGARRLLARRANAAVQAALQERLPDPRVLGWSHRVSRDDGASLTLALAVADEVHLDDGGAEAALRVTARGPRHRCAPPAPAPDPVPVPRDAVEGPVPSGAQVRIALGEAALARILWAAQQAGLGCVQVPLDEESGRAEVGRLLVPTAARLRPLGMGDPHLSVVPLSPPAIALTADGAVRASLSAVRVDVEAEVDGRTLRLASGSLSVEVQLRLTVEEGQLVLRSAAPPALEVTEVWAAPVLGAEEAQLRTSFGLVRDVAAAMAEDAVPLRLPLPEGTAVALVGQPRLAPRGRALVVDLALRRSP